ncbi:MAG: glycan-binding surface protein [Paludibacter sp.]
MKKIFSKNSFWGMVMLISLFAGSLAFTSCNPTDDFSATPVRVDSIFLENAASAVKDRKVSFARLGSLIRINGEGFLGVKKVYINGYETYFSPTMLTNNNLIINISGKTPTIEADSTVRNTIRFVKDGTSFTYKFQIRSSAPTITSISNTMPAVGDTITIYGTGLVEIEKITFPDSVVVTSGIVSSKTGSFCKVAMPAGVSANGGAILVEGSNGGVYSNAYFNCVNGLLINFDNVGSQGFWGWSATGSMLNASDLESTVIGTEGVKSQGKYCAHRPSRLTQFPASKNRCTEVWTAGNGVDKWREKYTALIPTTTPVSEFAFQFDIYVPQTWSNTGFLKICLINFFNGGEWSGRCFNYVPWIQNGVVVPFQTKGWTTVTIPFSNFYAYSDVNSTFTFENVLAARDAASYQNFGVYFENSDIKLSNITGNTKDANTTLASSATSISVYTDNWRLVPLSKPTYSDF